MEHGRGTRGCRDLPIGAPWARLGNIVVKVMVLFSHTTRFRLKYETLLYSRPRRSHCAMATLFLILDDRSTDFTYGGPQNWTVNEQPPWYGGTSIYPAFANVSTFGSFGVSFEGTSRSSISFKQFQ